MPLGGVGTQMPALAQWRGDVAVGKRYIWVRNGGMFSAHNSAQPTWWEAGQ
jgi:hypothetical protein